MELIILAGGSGKRLQSVVKDIPKPMADIAGKPFLLHLLNTFSRQGITKIWLSVGYKHEAIQNAVGLQYGGVEIEYVIEEKPLGTGGAIRKALNGTTQNPIFVCNGDTFFDVDLKQLKDFHIKNESIFTMALKPLNNFDRYGSVRLAGNRIIGFTEKGFTEKGLINAGMYVLNSNICDFLRPYPESFSFETDFLAAHAEKIKMCGFIHDGYFIDIGVPEDYKKAQIELPEKIYMTRPS